MMLSEFAILPRSWLSIKRENASILSLIRKVKTANASFGLLMAVKRSPLNEFQSFSISRDMALYGSERDKQIQILNKMVMDWRWKSFVNKTDHAQLPGWKSVFFMLLQLSTRFVQGATCRAHTASTR